MLSLSKFWRQLVNVKIIKIRHSNGHISYINQHEKKIFSCKNKHHSIASTKHLPSIYQVISSLFGQFHFCLHFFLSVSGQLFNNHPIFPKKRDSGSLRHYKGAKHEQCASWTCYPLLWARDEYPRRYRFHKYRGREKDVGGDGTNTNVGNTNCCIPYLHTISCAVYSAL